MEVSQARLLASDRVYLPVLTSVTTLPTLCDLQISFTNAFKQIQDLVISAVSNQEIISQLSSTSEYDADALEAEFGKLLADIVKSHLVKFKNEFMTPFTSDIKACILSKISKLFAAKPAKVA